MRAGRAAVAVVVAALASTGWVLAPGARADAPDATGWWARTRFQQPSGEAPWHPQLPGRPPTVPTAPQPTTVPPGGLYVAGEHATTPEEQVPDPNGSANPNVPSVGDPPSQHTGISAVRLEVGEHAAVGDLVLEINSVSDGAAGAPRVDDAEGLVAIQACPATVFWAPEEGGPIDSHPPYDCSTGLAFAAVEGSFVRVPVGGLVRQGLLDIVLMPQPGSAFQVSFEKPGPDSIAVTRFDPPDDGGSAEYEGFESGPAFGAGGGLPPAAPYAAPFASPVADLPVVVSAPGPLYTPRPPASGPSRRITAPAAQPIGTSVRELSPWQKAVAAAVLLGLVTLYLLLLREPLPVVPWAAARRAAREAAPEPRGIGRFARPRIGPSPRL